MNTVKETPEQKIKRLERELEDERASNLIMSEMVDVFDQKYGTALRKKYLARLRADCKRKGE